ncbi:MULTISPECIES: restriction endonuclease [unclassified Streptomyces]|uniref:restriction endonuclease n=1 Tax=unclassified Streptomyces TaxID=2593676 RepID=UPI0033233A09
MQDSARSKSMNQSAYLALVEALTFVFWNKGPFELYVRGMLKDHSELLAQLSFQSSTKREVSGQLVKLLRANEARYLDVTVALMLDIAAMETFPNLVSQEDAADKVAKATAAVAELKRWTAKQREVIAEHEAHAVAIAESAKLAQDGRAFAQAHDDLKQRFMVMYSATDKHQRGRDFEGFINELFALYDLEPRASYVMEHEQIDGAFSFDTDHYVLEAKWWKDAIGRPLLDIFKANIERKGKNTLGLYISMSGFTSDALDVYAYSTPFITMDGLDFMAVLDQRIRLDELMTHKRKHASQTGHCYLPVAKIFSQSE